MRALRPAEKIIAATAPILIALIALSCLAKARVSAVEVQQRASDEATLAAYTLWLTVFTGVLAAVAAAQGYLLLRQDRLANRQFIATFRPRLTVRALKLDMMSDERSLPIGVFTYHIANTGGSRARIVGGSIGSDLYPKGAEFPALSDLHPEFNTPFEGGPEVVIEGGASAWLTHLGGPTQLPESESEWYKRHSLMVNGLVIYADDNGVRRTLSFLRRYVPTTNRFEVVPDPDYEYAD